MNNVVKLLLIAYSNVNRYMSNYLGWLTYNKSTNGDYRIFSLDVWLLMSAAF